MPGQTRSNFEINISAFKAHVSDSNFPQDSKYSFSFLLQYLETPNIGSKK